MCRRPRTAWARRTWRASRRAPEGWRERAPRRRSQQAIARAEVLRSVSGGERSQDFNHATNDGCVGTVLALPVPARNVPAVKLAAGAGLVLALGTWVTLAAAAVPRTVPVVAGIVAVKGDEQVKFLDDPRWRVADLAQDLGAGDLLQTGRYGGLAVLFRDRTQIRVRANSSLLIKDVRPSSGPGETVIRLERGGTWSRATS